MKQLYKMRGGVLVTALLIAMAILFAGCGSDDDDDSPNSVPSSVPGTVSESDSGTPLTLEAIAAGTITVENAWSTLKYSKNDGELTAYPAAGIEVAVGDKVCFYATNSETSGEAFMMIGCSSDCYIYGNIMSLVSLTDGASLNDNIVVRAADSSLWNKDAKDLGENIFAALFAENTHIKNHDSKKLCLPATTLSENCYFNMFLGCSGLTEAPELPATTLTKSCYEEMFSGCTSLTKAPNIPATTLASSCCSGMFNGCTSLTEAPDLPDTTLAYECYAEMFSGCTSLTKAPALPATTLEDGCYTNMFNGCSSLTEAPELPATTLKTNCYTGMFEDCSSLEKAPELPATTLEENCYAYMFSGCSKLSYIKCLATAGFDSDECMTAWLDGAGSEATGEKIFILASEALPEDAIPSGWTKVYSAFVVTEPTATEGDILPGSTTALVTAGVAKGGTIMYKVTTENEKPASTEDFSETVPTAESLSSTGVYYVWYYVKAGEGYVDSSILGPVKVTVEKSEPVCMWVNFPKEDKPSSIYVRGSFKTDDNAMEVIESTGWYCRTTDSNGGGVLTARGSDDFYFCDASNTKLVLCEYKDNQWVKYSGVFGDFWTDDSYKGDACKWIEIDLSDATKYAWKTIE